MKKLFPNETIFETKYWKVQQDREIAIPGFFIAGLKREIRSLEEITDPEAKELGVMLRTVRKAMTSVLGIKTVYFFQQEDTKYGFHIWMLPYYPWMKRFGKGPNIFEKVWDYAHKNFDIPKKIRETKDAARKVKGYLQN